MESKIFNKLSKQLDSPVWLTSFALGLIAFKLAQVRSSIVLYGLFILFAILTALLDQATDSEKSQRLEMEASGVPNELEKTRIKYLICLALHRLCVGLLISYTVLIVARQI